MLKKHMNILRKAAIDYEYFQNNQLSRRNKVTGKIFKSESKNYVIDGHRIFSTKESIEIDGCEQIENQHIIELCKRHIKDSELCTFPVTIDMETLNAFIKSHKRSEKIPYVIDAGDFLIGVNPYYMRDHIEFIRSNIVYVNPCEVRDNGDYKHYNGGIYSANEDREVLTLPVALKNCRIEYCVNQAARKGY